MQLLNEVDNRVRQWRAEDIEWREETETRLERRYRMNLFMSVAALIVGLLGGLMGAGILPW